MYKLYSLDNVFIKEVNVYPDNFTGMIEFVTGANAWFLNGKIHRLNGPAHVSGNTKTWVIDGNIIKCKTQDEFDLYVSTMKLK